MATLGNGSRFKYSSKSEKSQLGSSLRIRRLLREGVASDDNVLNSSAQISNSLASSCVIDATSEATNRDAFFDRVESYTCLKWTGKPSVLSPLRCAQYGWINVDYDVLKCSSCEAFLCASIQPALDFKKYEGRILELTGQLQTQHEKFCSWPDFPCPERFRVVPVSEPEELLGTFLERFKSACFLQQHLPTIKPKQLKTMALTEDVISKLLQLIEDEQNMQYASSESPNIQMSACIVALCGWEASPGLYTMNLPILSCTYCMRKAGMWNFHQLDGVSGDLDILYSQSSTLLHDGRNGDRLMPTSPSQCLTPCRMKLRSQDNTRVDQSESTSSVLLVRTRNRGDSPIPSEETPRGKRPLTRSRGHGDNLVTEMPSSPQRKTKRPRFSAGGPEGLRSLFDPVGQHRSWCPWVTVTSEEWGLDKLLSAGGKKELPQSGWRTTLELLLSMKSNISPVGASPSQDSEDKSKRVLSIFDQ